MTIEIHSKLEALLQERMASGRFHSIEELLLEALVAAPTPAQTPERKQNLTQFLKKSPLWKSGLEVEKRTDFPRPVEL